MSCLFEAFDFFLERSGYQYFRQAATFQTIIKFKKEGSLSSASVTCSRNYHAITHIHPNINNNMELTNIVNKLFKINESSEN